MGPREAHWKTVRAAAAAKVRMAAAKVERDLLMM